jgi:hypothetical protein
MLIRPWYVAHRSLAIDAAAALLHRGRGVDEFARLTG